MRLKITEVAQLIDGEIDGDDSLYITDVAKIEEAEDGHLAFISNPRYAKYIETTNASAVLVSKDFPETDKTVIRTENPYFAFLKLLIKFHPPIETLEPGIHPTAVIDSSAQIGEKAAVGAHVVIGKGCCIGNDVKIHPGVVISDDVTVGENTILYPNVTIREGTKIGKNVIIHNGAVVGSDPALERHQSTRLSTGRNHKTAIRDRKTLRADPGGGHRYHRGGPEPDVGGTILSL